MRLKNEMDPYGYLYHSGGCYLPASFAGANRKAGELVDGGIGTTLFRAEAEVIAKMRLKKQ